MGFKENLQKKIKADHLARRVIQSLKPADSGTRFDAAAMRELLEIGGYPLRRERDLELYILENDAAKKKILVLDNGLAIYHTTIEDVCLRKSPTVKEMLSIRNAVKILSDKDVVLSKKEDSVRTVQTDVIQRLDLAYTDADIEQIEKEGQASLESRYAEGVTEALTLFAELLGYRDAPKIFAVPHHLILGPVRSGKNGETVLGPPVIAYDKVNNRLKMIDSPVGSFDKEKMTFLRQVIDGRADADKEGLPVFAHLRSLVPKYQS